MSALTEEQQRAFRVWEIHHHGAPPRDCYCAGYSAAITHERERITGALNILISANESAETEFLRGVREAIDIVRRETP